MAAGTPALVASLRFAPAGMLFRRAFSLYPIYLRFCLIFQSSAVLFGAAFSAAQKVFSTFFAPTFPKTPKKVI
jgi:hypothetical protein